MHYTPNCAAQQVELNHPKFGQPLQATNEPASRCSLGSFSLLSGYGNMAAVAAASQHPALGSVSRTPPLFSPHHTHARYLSSLSFSPPSLYLPSYPPLSPYRRQRQPPSLPNLFPVSRSTRRYPLFVRLPGHPTTPPHLGSFSFDTAPSLFLHRSVPLAQPQDSCSLSSPTCSAHPVHSHSLAQRIQQ